MGNDLTCEYCDGEGRFGEEPGGVAGVECRYCGGAGVVDPPPRKRRGGLRSSVRRNERT